MKFSFLFAPFASAVLALATTPPAAAAPWHLPLDQPEAAEWSIHGHAETVPGAKGGALQLDGRSLIEVKDSAATGSGAEGFSFVLWCNPFHVRDGQHMIVAKNRYGKGEREWGVMIDTDGKFRLYLWQGKWTTVEAQTAPKPGHWHQVGVVVRPESAELWLNGRREGRVDLAAPVAATAAPLTLGGVLEGSPRQTWFGALDDFRLFDRALSEVEMAELYEPVAATLEIPEMPLPESMQAHPFWTRVGAEDAMQDRSLTLFDGRSPDKLACDTTLRRMPDGSWVHVMLGGGDKEPDPRNGVFLQRSLDEGGTWSALERLDFGFPKDGDTRALVPTELMVHDGRCTLYFATHDGTFGGWKSWSVTSEDSCKSWGSPQPLPGRLHDRTFIRNLVVARDGRLLLPFQHYEDAPRSAPVNGVLISADGGRTWSEHGNIRLTENRAYQGWAENNVVELLDGRIAMIIRADSLGGVLYQAESTDGGLTWPALATKTGIPNPGSKATLYGLGGDSVALLHNPNPKTRSPLALWISFDGMKTWPYQRILRGDLEGRFNYPDGFVSADKRWLHFAFDHNRDKAILVSARLPEIPALWDDARPLPKAADLPVLEGVRFSVIKRYEFQKDGYRFLHGLGLGFHRGKLYASFGHNQGGENTDTEEARFCVSEDDGKSWSEVRTMDAGEVPVGVSHGSFLSHDGKLWAFMGAYTGTMQGIHTRAYRLSETSGIFEALGTVIEGGFWPMQEPLRMDDGNWIMAGITAGVYDEKGTHPAAVAISQGDDFTKWDLVPITPVPGLPMWGESTVIVEGKRVTNISRYGAEARALIATSEDYGRTWGEMRPSNLPMATSKPIAGTLSTGQRYLVCTTTADSGGRRSPLTIAVSEPGETLFSKVFVIRHALFPEGPGESHQGAALSYPYAVEHDGKLYVGYSNSGDKSTRVGTGRELWNNNSAELAVIPVASLSVAAEASPVATLESRGLPRILFNNDSDDLKWPAYPEHHANGLWVPAGEYLPLPTINSLDDALAPRIGPLAKTKTQGLSYCGNFGLPIWELKRDHIAALGDDPLQPILQFWKRDGRTFFFSMRMNDVHHGWFNWAHLWDDFRRTHRDLFLKPPTDKEWEAEFLPWFEGKTSKRPAISTSSVAFDYSRAEVRTYYLETLREACRRYDLDGVELDWLRYPDLFREREVDVAVMTAFVRDARAVLDEAAKRRGHPLRLLARVPVTPEQALSVGLDVEAWLKAGWLDAVIAGPGTSFSSCPLERWVDLAHRHGVPVYGSMERQNRNNVPRYGSPETLRAAIATLWEKGADGLYFFNFYIRDEMPLLDEFADRAVLARLPKEYFLESGGDKDLTKSGGPLPLALKPVTPATVHLVIADDPAKAREASLEIVFKAAGEFEPPLTTLNGQPLQELKSTSAKEGFTLTLSSAALKQALKHRTNAFTFTSPATVTLTSLSVRVVP